MHKSFELSELVREYFTLEAERMAAQEALLALVPEGNPSLSAQVKWHGDKHARLSGYIYHDLITLLEKAAAEAEAPVLEPQV